MFYCSLYINSLPSNEERCAFAMNFPHCCIDCFPPKIQQFGRSKKPTTYSLPTELICEILHLDVQGSSWYAPTTLFIICTLITNARHVDCSTKLQNHVNSGNRSSVPLGHVGTTIPRNSLLAHFRKWSTGPHKA